MLLFRRLGEKTPEFYPRYWLHLFNCPGVIWSLYSNFWHVYRYFNDQIEDWAEKRRYPNQVIRSVPGPTFVYGVCALNNQFLFPVLLFGQSSFRHQIQPSNKVLKFSSTLTSDNGDTSPICFGNLFFQFYDILTTQSRGHRGDKANCKHCKRVWLQPMIQ